MVAAGATMRVARRLRLARAALALVLLMFGGLLLPTRKSVRLLKMEASCYSHLWLYVDFAPPSRSSPAAAGAAGAAGDTGRTHTMIVPEEILH